MLMWKIVVTSKVLVLYRYIDYKFDLKRYYFIFICVLISIIFYYKKKSGLILEFSLIFNKFMIF